MESEILVIVVAYNGEKWLQKCLSSVYSSTVKADVFVVDNASQDSSAEIVKKYFPQAILHVSKENLGFAQANNLGFAYALSNSYNFVYLLNQDAWVLKDTFAKLIEAHKAMPKFGIISPFQMKADMSGLDEQFRNHAFVKSHDDLPYSVHFVMAAHWLVSRECLESVGFFSPAFKHYGEDNNYCDRALYHGFLIGVVPSATGVHDRASRPRPKKYRMEIKARMARVRISNPKFPTGTEIIVQTLWLCAMSAIHRSMIPVRSVPSLFRDYKELARLKNISKNPGAFIPKTVSDALQGKL